MAVYRRGYQRYQGPINGRWARFLVLPRFAWKRLFQRRLVVLFSIISLIYPILCAIFIYISNHVELLKTFGTQFQTFLQVKETFFFAFMSTQATFAIFLAALAGPGLIAPDLSNNALPLYFSRPLTRKDYVLGRIVTLFGMLSIITWIPGLLLFVMQASMAGGSWFLDNWKMGLGIFTGLSIWILLLSLVALASSAYVKLRAVAGGLVLGFIFILGGASAMINGVFRSTSGHAVDPFWATRRLWSAMLSTDPPAGPGVLECTLTLIILFVLLIFVLERKLRPVEVIS